MPSLQIKFRPPKPSENTGKKTRLGVDSRGLILYFPSLAAFQKFFSPQKIALLALIRQQQPKSLYELANMADRKFPAVFHDVKALVRLGFVALAANGDPRGSQRPQLAFSYDKIEVVSGNGAFQISIGG